MPSSHTRNIIKSDLEKTRVKTILIIVFGLSALCIGFFYNPELKILSQSKKAHYKGMALIEQGVDLDSAIQSCGSSFRSGCIHGAVMEYIEKYFPSPDGTAFLNICNRYKEKEKIYFNCLHGIGHELYVYSRRNINAALDKCSFSTKKEKRACSTGIFMEYTKGDTGNFFHSELPAGAIDPPCDMVDNGFKDDCYLSLGFYRSYFYNESFMQRTIHCMQPHIKNYFFQCMIGTIESYGAR